MFKFIYQRLHFLLLIFLVTIPTAVINKSNLRKEFIWAHSSRVKSTVPRKSWCQELEAAGHTSSTVSRNRVTNAGSLPASFFHEVQDASLWNGDAHGGQGPPTSNKITKMFPDRCFLRGSRCYQVDYQY